MNKFLDLVADEFDLPPESEFEITKSIWDWLEFVYIDDDITEEGWSRENHNVRRSKLFMYGEPKSSVRYLDNEIYDVRSPYPIECIRPRTSVSLSTDALFLIHLLSELLVSEIPIGRNSGSEEILKVKAERENVQEGWSRENHNVRRSKLFMYGEPKSSVRYLDNEIYDVRSPYPIECIRPRTSVSLSTDALFLIHLLSELLVSEIPIGRNSGSEEILKVKAERENVRQNMTLLVQIIAEIPVRIFFLVVYNLFLLCQNLFL